MGREAKKKDIWPGIEQEYIRGQTTKEVASYLKVAKDYKGCRTLGLADCKFSKIMRYHILQWLVAGSKGCGWGL